MLGPALEPEPEPVPVPALEHELVPVPEHEPAAAGAGGTGGGAVAADIAGTEKPGIEACGGLDTAHIAEPAEEAQLGTRPEQPAVGAAEAAHSTSGSCHCQYHSSEELAVECTGYPAGPEQTVAVGGSCTSFVETCLIVVAAAENKRIPRNWNYYSADTLQRRLLRVAGKSKEKKKKVTLDRGFPLSERRLEKAEDD